VSSSTRIPYTEAKLRWAGREVAKKYHLPELEKVVSNADRCWPAIWESSDHLGDAWGVAVKDFFEFAGVPSPAKLSYVALWCKHNTWWRPLAELDPEDGILACYQYQQSIPLITTPAPISMRRMLPSEPVPKLHPQWTALREEYSKWLYEQCPHKYLLQLVREGLGETVFPDALRQSLSLGVNSSVTLVTDLVMNIYDIVAECFLLEDKVSTARLMIPYTQGLCPYGVVEQDGKMAYWLIKFV